MKLFKNFATLITAIIALLSCGCEMFGGDTPTKPTISISDLEFDAETMTVKAIITPSSNTEAWSYKVENSVDGPVEYTKREWSFGDDIFFDVTYGVQYTVSAFAENKGGKSEVVTQSICPMPEGEVAISIGEITLNEKTMEAEATIVPSTNTTTWYWSYGEKESEAEIEWTEVKSNKQKRVTFAYEWGKNYVLRAYSTCGAVECEVVVAEFYFEPSLPTITVSKPMFDEATMTVSFNVTPSEDTYRWYWGPQYDVTGEPQVPFEYNDNEARTVSYTIDYNVDYTFVFGAVNAINKGERKEVEFSVMSPCVDIAIENLTAFTIDAAITMKDNCVRYVAGAVHTNAYNRNTFIEQAQSSLNPNEDYPFAVFNSATESHTFSEQDLVRNSLITSDDNAGLLLVPGTSYTIAVYGENSEGMSSVVTKEFVVPTATLDGNVGIEINVSDIEETSAVVNISATEACKMIFGYMDPTITKADTDNPFDFEGKSDEEIRNYIVSVAHDIPMFYTEPIKRTLSHQLAIGGTYYAYAIAIKDGKIGNAEFTKFTTKVPSLTGIAKVTSAEIVEQTTHETLTVVLTTDSNAKKVRLYAAPATDHASYQDNLEYIMDANSYQNYREEYDVVNGVATAVVNIYHPGSNYYMYAVAVDGEGKAGEMVCVTTLAGLNTEYYTTIEEIAEELNVSLDGTGTVDMVVTVIGQTDDRISVTINTDSRSANADKVWLIRFNGMISDIEENVRYAFRDYPNDNILGSYKEAIVGFPLKYEDGGSAWDPKYEALQEYTSQWGGDVIVAVVLDNEGKLNIYSYYAAGGSVVVL